jgi:hypothetical protein
MHRRVLMFRSWFVSLFSPRCRFCSSKRYRKQSDMFDYNLRDLFDLLEENISKGAILICHTYEVDLYPLLAVKAV